MYFHTKINTVSRCPQQLVLCCLPLVLHYSSCAYIHDQPWWGHWQEMWPMLITSASGASLFCSCWQPFPSYSSVHSTLLLVWCSSFSRTFLISFLIILSQFISRFIQMIGSYLHPDKPGDYLVLYLTCRAIDDATVANMYFVLYGYSTSRFCVRTSSRLG